LEFDKIDLLPYLAFDMETARTSIGNIYPSMPIFEMSATTEAGMDEWIGWLMESAKIKLKVMASWVWLVLLVCWLNSLERLPAAIRRSILRLKLIPYHPLCQNWVRYRDQRRYLSNSTLTASISKRSLS
jgi:hypothetical protein